MSRGLPVRSLVYLTPYTLQKLVLATGKNIKMKQNAHRIAQVAPCFSSFHFFLLTLTITYVDKCRQVDKSTSRQGPLISSLLLVLDYIGNVGASPIIGGDRSLEVIVNLRFTLFWLRPSQYCFSLLLCFPPKEQ